MTTRATIPVLIAAAVGAGCSGTRPPTVTAVDLREAARTDEATVLRFELEARNRNPDALPLREAIYTLTVDGREVFSARRSPEATLAPFDTRRFEIPAVIPAGAMRPGATYRLAGRVTYLTPGALARIFYDADLLIPETTFAITGSLGDAE